MLRTGVTAMPAPLRLHLSGWAAGRPVHQASGLLWSSGFDITHNPVWLEPSAIGLCVYFLPEDNRSTLYIHEVETD